MKCPNCNRVITNKARSKKFRVIGVYQCQCCGAVLGQCYKGESFTIVKPWFAKSYKEENVRHYDLSVLGGEGIERRHGWFDITTGLITQAG